MNRETRRQIWQDETAHPASPTTRAAMEASGASLNLLDSWQELEGSNASDWMTYMDFVEGHIGMSVEHQLEETMSPNDWARYLVTLKDLWLELGMVTDERYDVDGLKPTRATAVCQVPPS